MKLEFLRPLCLGLMAFLVVFPYYANQVTPVRAIPGCFLGTQCICQLAPCQTTTWSPYGPIVQNLQLNFYSDPSAELNDFLTGHLDITDLAVPTNRYSSFDLSQDFVQSPATGQFGLFGIFFNGASSRFTASKEYDTGAGGPFWGCNWNTGTPFTNTEQTYVSQCGISMRQAFLHLVDRPKFAASFGNLVALADPSPPFKDPSGSSVATQCSWDSLYPSVQYPTCLGAYNFADDPSGFAQPGSPDFCAAADHMIAAGVATGEQAGSCTLTGVNSGVFAHPLRLIIKGSDSVRRALAIGFSNSLNQLFSGAAVAPCYGLACNYAFLVFTDPPDGLMDDWDAYTYGYSLGGPYADNLYSLFSSQGASDLCGGVQNGYPNNPTFVCIPQLDQYTLAASQTSDVNTFRSDTLAAFNVYGAHAVDMPVYTHAIRTVALRCVAGLVNQVGVGYSNFWTMLNGHMDPNCTPSNPIYSFGGGDPTTLRSGQASPTLELNIFRAQTVWEFNILGEVYDTLFNASPAQPGSIFCWMCNSYTRSVDNNGDTHFLVELRLNLRWADGVSVDAKDVKFSLLNLRDFASAASGQLTTVKSVSVFNPSTLDIVFNGQSISFPVALEGAFIIPRHIWELQGDTTYGEIGRVDPAKLSPAYDPIAAGTFIGSGPFSCRSLFPEDMGRIGAGCTKDYQGNRVGQALPVGGSMTLQSFDFTSQATDPFYQYMRSYNPAWGTGSGASAESGQFQEFSYSDGPDRDAHIDIADVSSIAVCFGANPANNYNSGICGLSNYNYWHRSAFETNQGTIGIGELATVAAHYGEEYVYPFSWNPPSLIGIVAYQ